MGTPHNEAQAGEFAKTVLMPGDPLRARFIAETFLEAPRLVNNVQGRTGLHGNLSGNAGIGHGVRNGSALHRDLFLRALPLL